MEAEKLNEKIERIVDLINQVSIDLGSQPQHYEDAAIRVVQEEKPQYVEQFKALIKMAHHPLLSEPYKKFLYWCAIDDILRFNSGGRHRYSEHTGAAAQRDLLIAELFLAAAKIMQIAIESVEKLSNSPGFTKFALTCSTTPENLAQLRRMVRQSKILTNEVLEDIQTDPEFEWARHALIWTIENYRLGDTKSGELLIEWLEHKEETRDCLLLICERYLEANWELDTLPYFSEQQDGVLVTLCYSSETYDLAEDFVALMCDPPHITAGAYELYAQLIETVKRDEAGDFD